MKSLIPISVLWLLASVQLYAQQVWPGDVTNNGIVNQVDVIYWAYALDAVGSSRIDAGSEWEGYALPDIIWAESFPNGLNFAYADCNGNGIIDSLDFNIIKEHYWFKRDSVDFEEIPIGIPGVDPPLELLANSPYTSPEEVEELSISVGSEYLLIDSLIGISFTLRFSPDDIQNTEEDNGFSLELLEDTWFNQGNNDSALSSIYVNRDSGIVSIVFFRESSDSLGWGVIAKLETIIEDFVIFSTINFELDSAVYYNLDLEPRALAAMGLTLEVIDSLASPIPNPGGIGGGGLPGEIGNPGVILYPNPSNGRTVIETEDKGNNKLKYIKVHSLGGAPIEEIRLEEPVSTYILDTDAYAPGFYLVSVLTEIGTSNKPLIVLSMDNGIGD